MKLLFYVPYSNIWTHAAVEAVLAEQLVKLGHEITIVRCKGLLNQYCPAMSESGLLQDSTQQQRDEICNKCISRGQNIDKTYRFDSVVLDDFFLEGDDSLINDWQSQISPEDWDSFEIDGIQIGRIASYEFLLTNKINSPRFSGTYWKYYTEQFANTTKTFVAMKRLLKKYQPDGVIVHNSLYSSNRVVVKISEQLNIPTFHLGVGTDLNHYGDSFSLFRTIQEEIELNTSKGWEQNSKKPLTKNRIRPVIESFLGIANSKSAFTYSSKVKGTSPEILLSTLGLQPGLPNCVALLSSADERFAADMVGALPYSLASLDTVNFSSQIEWVEHLISLFSRRPDLQLIIRVHPRLFPNKREKVLSEAGLALKKAISELPPNVVVNWPEENIALYDLAQITDVCLNATSSAGGEMLALGIPVVCHEPERLFSYPREFNIVPSSISDYEKVIDQAIAVGWSIENSKNAFRWKAFQFNDVARSLSESLPLRSRWSLLRLSNGIDLRTNLPVPQFILRLLERAEMNRRAKQLSAARDLEDLILHKHNNLGEVCSLDISEENAGNRASENELVLTERNRLYMAFFGDIPARAKNT